MPLEDAGRVLLLDALADEVALLTGDSEIVDAGRCKIDPADHDEIEFGPARLTWIVTGVALFHGGERVLTQALARSENVAIGQRFQLSLRLAVELV